MSWDVSKFHASLASSHKTSAQGWIMQPGLSLSFRCCEAILSPAFPVVQGERRKNFSRKAKARHKAGRVVFGKCGSINPDEALVSEYLHLSDGAIRQGLFLARPGAEGITNPQALLGECPFEVWHQPRGAAQHECHVVGDGIRIARQGRVAARCGNPAGLQHLPLFRQPGDSLGARNYLPCRWQGVEGQQLPQQLCLLGRQVHHASGQLVRGGVVLGQVQNLHGVPSAPLRRFRVAMVVLWGISAPCVNNRLD